MKALEKKNTDQERKHARMITLMDRVVDSQDNQLRHQKFEMGELQQEMKDMKVEQLREHTQDVKELKDLKELREIEVKEQKEMTDIGEETAERLKVEHDEKVHKLEEDNKDLKSQVERFKENGKTSS